MNARHRRLLCYVLAITGIVCSIFSLFALFELRAPGWILPLNVFAVLVVLLAAKLRGRGFASEHGDRRR